MPLKFIGAGFYPLLLELLNFSDGKIAELEIRETYDMKNVSDSGIFPDEVQKNISTKMKFSGFFLKSGLSTTKKNVDKVDHQQ